MQQVEHERNLKLNAFERVDELQRQVNISLFYPEVHGQVACTF